MGFWRRPRKWRIKEHIVPGVSRRPYAYATLHGLASIKTRIRERLRPARALLSTLSSYHVAWKEKEGRQGGSDATIADHPVYIRRSIISGKF